MGIGPIQGHVRLSLAPRAATILTIESEDRGDSIEKRPPKTYRQNILSVEQSSL